MNSDCSNQNAIAGPMTQEEFAAWVASRKDAGRSIDIATADLEGWSWVSESDPYAKWRPALECRSDDADDDADFGPHYFVRGPDSCGWVWQSDLPEDKQVAVQARIDEHARMVEEFRENRKAAGRLIDIENCELGRLGADDDDPYNIKLASYGQVGTNRFV
jgi:hypothetical protein